MHVEGPLLVLAGPGSGKTRVITHRIAYMIEEAGVDPSEILALTFTNKAAEEMRRHVEQLVPGRRIFAGTFHRLCARLLRRYASQVGLEPGYSILEPSELLLVIKGIMKEMDLDPVHLPPDSVQRRISVLKNDLVSPEEFPRRPSTTLIGPSSAFTAIADRSARKMRWTSMTFSGTSRRSSGLTLRSGRSWTTRIATCSLTNIRTRILPSMRSPGGSV